jgi:amino acid adenylation domain-containing protein
MTEPLGQRFAPLDVSDAAACTPKLSGSKQAGGGRKRLRLMMTPSDHPLSAAQLGIWHAIKAGASILAFNIADYTKIFGAIDPALFETALRRVVEETEALCVSFVERDVPSQIIATPPDWSMTYRDVSAQADPIAAAEAWMRNDLVQPVDLCEGPFFAFALFKTAAEEFLWYARYHHIVMDAFGASLIAHRVAEIYSALASGLDVTDRPFGSVASLVAEDAAYRGSARFDSDRRFWRDLMAECPEPLNLGHRPLPSSAPSPTPAQFLRQTTFLPSTTVARLQDFAQRMRLTVPQVMTAAIAIFVHRLTEAEDVVLGQFLTARMTAAATQTPAMMSNVLPLRVSIQPGMSVGALMAQIPAKTLSGLVHQRYRIADLRRDLRRIPKPIFGLSISVRKFDYDMRFAGHRSTNCMISNGPVDDLDIHFVFDRSERGDYRVDFNANPALYDMELLGRLQNRLLRLLAAIDDPDELIGRLDILPPDERRQTLIAWNETRADYPRERQIHELFEEQAQRTPDRVALVYAGQQLTYRDLNEQADRVARHLLLLGVGPDRCVALHVERSLAMVVGLLGILKSGGAYVPLDPNYPHDRLGFILEDAQPLVLLTQRSLRDRLHFPNGEIVCLDDLPKLRDRTEPEPATNKRQASDLAYVIYTSGSTGRPKGVQIPHRALVNFLTAMQHEPGITEDDKLLSVTSLSFDIAGLEVFLPLIVGAQVTIAPSDAIADGVHLAALMESCGATFMQATPATWRLLLEADWKGSPDLKILCGGEAWSVELARALLPRCASLWNMYGPTETTVWSAAARIEADQRVLIGPPIANTTFYVLDICGKPVPIGVPGELAIGGDGVARGYLNRPELTQERFVVDPFSNTPDARLYKTGDRVRQLADGSLEFLGRLDHQVKIRGYRIELGEIESVLRLHPEVQDAVVVAHDGRNADPRLVAYVTANGPEPVSFGALRTLLRQKLPAHMMPSVLVPLEAFPLTPNGKIDRKALPLPNEILRDAHEAYVAPRTQLEEFLVGVWSELLHLSRVGVHDNFFDLGGSSLLMLQLSRKIEQATGQTFPLTFIYDAPTVAGMAEILGGERSVPRFSPLVLLRPGADAPPVFIVHGVGGSAMELIPIAKSTRGNHPIYGIQARGFDGTQPPLDRVEAMADYYLETITEVQPRGPYFLVGHSSGGLIAMEIAQRLLKRGDRIGVLALLETYPDYHYWTLQARVNTLLIRRLKRHWAAKTLPLSIRKLIAFAQGAPLPLMIAEDALPPAARAVLEGGLAAVAHYVPRYYPGKVNYMKCEINTLVPSDPIPIWGKLIQELDIQSIPGDHEHLISTHAGDVANWLSNLIEAATSGKPSRVFHSG